MLEISDIRIPLESFPADEPGQIQALTRALARRLGLNVLEIKNCKLRKRSFDARKHGAIKVVCTAQLELARGHTKEQEISLSVKGARLVDGEQEPHSYFTVPAQGPTSVPAQGPTSAPTQSATPTKSTRSKSPLEDRPVVVGAGCAGLFCTLALAEAGLEPLLVERGSGSRKRTEDVEIFNQKGILDTESNIQFGLGGAGTFSDGKLYTGTRAASHKNILATFVDAGASPSILVDSHPHIGSDVLPQVVENIKSRIETLGGEVALETALSGIQLKGTGITTRTLTGIQLRHKNSESLYPCTQLVLACGHSARDVFELLAAQKVELERKSFAMGVRIEHLQAEIDRALWGKDAGNPVLGAAPYKLVSHAAKSKGGRSVFSFCMCPGGLVVAAASEPETVVTNGMSNSARNGVNANAGLLANVEPSDLPGTDPLAGIALQRECEQAAYRAGGGAFVAPAQLVADFLAGQPSTGHESVVPSYPRGVAFGSIDGILPPYILDALRTAIPDMGRKLRGFDTADAVLTGVESRSSSPVRVLRDESLQSRNTLGLYPAGEGAGYAGGIMSAAADGIRVAEAIIKSLQER